MTRGPPARRDAAPMPARALTIALVAAVAVAGCGGDSKSDEAKASVCSARADVSKQLDSLKGLTISTATTSKIQDGLKAIDGDLKKMKDARGDLDNDRREQVDDANQAFEAQVKTIASSLGSTTSLADASTQLNQAFDQLGTAYQQTFAKIDCG
jgi:hypothetical protein